MHKYPKIRPAHILRFTVLLGKCVFLNPQDAAKLAQQWTEHQETAFSFALDEPMRRTWEMRLSV